MADANFLMPVEARISFGALRKLSNKIDNSQNDLVGVFHARRAAIETKASALYDATKCPPCIDLDDIELET